MNKIDLIIEAIRLAEYHVKVKGWGDDIDLELYTEALAAARELKALKPVGGMIDSAIEFAPYTGKGEESKIKPVALRLADELLFAGRFAHESEDVAARRRINRNSEAAAELRRLHDVNADMLSALRAIVAVAETETLFSMQTIKDCANIAIKQASGKT